MRGKLLRSEQLIIHPRPYFGISKHYYYWYILIYLFDICAFNPTLNGGGDKKNQIWKKLQIFF